MAESCSICFLGTMDRLWFHQIILSSSSPSTALLFHSTFKTPEPISETLGYPSPNISQSPPLEEEISSADPSDDITISEDESNNQHDDDDEEEEKEEEVELKERATTINLTSSNYSSSVSPPSNQIHPKRLRSFSSSGSVRRLQKTTSCRSMSELELEEVKGFMDLGFKFNREHVSPRMMSVLPGLLRLGICGMNEQIRRGRPDETGVGEEKESGVTRPYLSEAWLIKRPNSPLLNLTLPRVSAAAAMKKHLRSWARTVASVIQQDY